MRSWELRKCEINLHWCYIKANPWILCSVNPSWKRLGFGWLVGRWDFFNRNIESRATEHCPFKLWKVQRAIFLSCSSFPSVELHQGKWEKTSLSSQLFNEAGAFILQNLAPFQLTTGIDTQTRVLLLLLHSFSWPVSQLSGRTVKLFATSQMPEYLYL